MKYIHVNERSKAGTLQNRLKIAIDRFSYREPTPTERALFEVSNNIKNKEFREASVVNMQKTINLLTPFI